MSIAPYHVVIIPISTKDKDHMEISEKLYKELTQQGIEVVLDDRNERPGVKFKDADLIGFPIRLTIGKKSVNEGLIEYKLRTEDSSKEIPLSIIAETVINYLRS